MNRAKMRKELPTRITFDQYRESNPRARFPDIDMLDFLTYAEQRYVGEEHRDDVNWTHNLDTAAEKNEEVESYLGDAMEALLLYREYREAKGRSP